ncbi:MAG: RNA polymerase II transcription factor B subunit 4 [Ramalina farinacea]|uniref:General transcription and DNA repair factor IIH subunit TFB4 n=1 Tax=Ramalina farinacea TaxID=258253 RepID=A0AA43QH95_9LECA|nr:RNA polymerase II transcription factor B subunit 4 [Ramalina farinacea]
MNAVDGSDHYSKTSDEPPPSLLTIILDTNPHAWALLAPTLPLSAAIANLLVFINAHLAFNNANKVCVIASHTRRAEFLYPPRPTPPTTTTTNNAPDDSSDDEAMPDPSPSPPKKHSQTLLDDANHYRPFTHLQRTLLSALSTLFATTNSDTLTATTAIAGALTLALTYINKQQLLASATVSGPASSSTTNTDAATTTQQSPGLISRILILSVSGDLAHQYIPLMNTIFACQRMAIPIDIAKISGDTVFLQQASDATGGVYIKIKQPKGLLHILLAA